MKNGTIRIKCLLLALLLLLSSTLASCANEAAETSLVFDSSAASNADENKEIPFVYISYHGWATGKETMYSATDWHLVTNRPTVHDEQKIGTKISEFRGLKLDFDYVSTCTTGNVVARREDYWCHSCDDYCGNSLGIDSETGELLCCRFNHFPEGYDIRTDRIQNELVEDCVREFLAKYAPHEKLEEYVVNYFDDRGKSFTVVYRKYKNGVMIADIHVELDKCGNVLFYRKNIRIRDNYDVPYITDDEYLEMAKVRIYEFYESYENAVEIKDFTVMEKTGGHDWMNESYFVAIDVSFTVIYDDGSQLGHRNDFIYYFE